MKTFGVKSEGVFENREGVFGGIVKMRNESVPNVESLSLCSVILNEVKNLNAFSLCIQILRFAQDDILG